MNVTLIGLKERAMVVRLLMLEHMSLALLRQAQ